MLLLSEAVGSEEAVRIGLAQRVSEDSELPAAITVVPAPFTAGPTAAYRLVIRLLRDSRGASLPDQLEAEAYAMQTSGRMADYNVGVDSFHARRQPIFTNN